MDTPDHSTQAVGASAPVHTDEDLSGARFERVDLRGSTFHTVDLGGASLSRVSLTDATVRFTELRHVLLHDVELQDVDITGDLLDVRVNGVDVVPLVGAELDRRDPDRPRMRPTGPDGFRQAWALVEQRWDETVERARALPPDLLHASVEGEWSFVETLRHLVFVTDAWVRRGVLGDPAPWHPLDLPWDDMAPTPGVPRDREARPGLDEVLALRHDRLASVRRLLAGLTDAELERTTTAQDSPGWPAAGATYPVRTCLLVLLDEEYQHRLFAERDLATLVTRTDRPS